MQRGPTHRTRWSLLRTGSAPGAALALLSGILDQLSLQSAHPRMNLVLNFAHGRFGMAFSPLFDLCQNLLAQCSPLLFRGFVHFRLHSLVPSSYPFPFWLSTPLQNNDAHSTCYMTNLIEAGIYFVAVSMAPAEDLRLVEAPRSGDESAFCNRSFASWPAKSNGILHRALDVRRQTLNILRPPCAKSPQAARPSRRSAIISSTLRWSLATRPTSPLHQFGHL